MAERYELQARFARLYDGDWGARVEMPRDAPALSKGDLIAVESRSGESRTCQVSEVVVTSGAGSDGGYTLVRWEAVSADQGASSSAKRDEIDETDEFKTDLLELGRRQPDMRHRVRAVFGTVAGDFGALHAAMRRLNLRPTVAELVRYIETLESGAFAPDDEVDSGSDAPAASAPARPASNGVVVRRGVVESGFEEVVVVGSQKSVDNVYAALSGSEGFEMVVNEVEGVSVDLGSMLPLQDERIQRFTTEMRPLMMDQGLRNRVFDYLLERSREELASPAGMLRAMRRLGIPPSSAALLELVNE